MGRFIQDETRWKGLRGPSLHRRRYKTGAGQHLPWFFDETLDPPVGFILTNPVTVRILTRAQLEALPAWKSAFASLVKDHRYQEVVEDTLHPEFVHKYLVVFGDGDAVIAIQPFFVLDQDLLEGVSGRVKALIASMRKRWPKFLTMRTLMLGCVAGEGHLDDRGTFANPTIVQALAASALDAARREKAGLVVFKEFMSKYRRHLLPLKAMNFAKVPSLPMASLDINYKSFDDYMTKALSASTRKDLRRKFKAASRASLSLEITNDASAVIDEIYPLYLNVYNRSSLHFEKLTKDYLVELGRRMPERTRFFIWRKDGRIVAFNLCFVHGDSIYDQYIGLDYTVALDLHLYHYTFRDIVSWAMANGYKWYRTAGLNYDPKLRLRMQLDPLDLYVRHRSSLVNTALKLVLPWLEPTQYDEHLKKFSNYQDLKATL